MRKPVAGASLNRRSATPEETESFGATLASAFSPQSDAVTVAYLRGDLGAGKTTLVRGFLHALGVTESIRSPTYTLLETYESSAVTVVHLDLYRLRDATELEPLGLRDLARPGCVWLVEWPERGAGWLPPADLDIALTVGRGAHEITVCSGSRAGEAWLARVNA